MKITFDESAYKVRRGATTVSSTGAGHSSTVATGLNTVVSCVGNLTTAPSTGGLAPANAVATISATVGSVDLKCYTYLYTATTSTGDVTVNWIAVGT